jgi:membrane-bound serine protease (ClpP class)
MTKSLRALLVCLLSAMVLGIAQAAMPADQSSADRSGYANSGLLLEIHDAIGPASSDFFVRALEEAEERKAPLVIVELDTPGGLDTAMRDMIQAILAAPMPVVVYVSPSGARAASAGTYLLYASHVAAMAPATNLGAATPVSIGGSPEPSSAPKSPRDGEATGSAQGTPSDAADGGTETPAAADEPAGATAMERKAVNDAVAYIRSLAELRDRNADWAEEAVRSAASLSANEALERNVIDIVASDVADLLGQLDGVTVDLPSGEHTIETTGLVLEKIDADWRVRLLAVITNPTVAYLMMLVGIYGLLFEGYNPGAIVPGVVGAICLLLALFAFQILSVNYAGLALILLGVLLIVAEAFVPSFGALGLGGIVAFVIGSVILLDTDVPGFAVALPLIGALGLVGALATLGIVTFAVRSWRKPVVTGREQLLHEIATALGDFEGQGTVRLHGEIWNAVARSPVTEGQRLRVIGVDGLTLEVEPLELGALRDRHA